MNQNDARPADLDVLRSFGPYDVHLLQYSGAIWWPWAYELPAAAQRSFGAAKRANGLDRALRYVTAVGARHVVPFAGPACFLDEDLFALNDLTRDPANTFPDQMVFLDYLREHGVDGGQLLTPGAVLTVDHHHGRVRWPAGEQQAMEPFTDKARYLRCYAARAQDRIAAARRGWPARRTDVAAELKAWFEPLLELAGHIRAGVGGPVLLRAGDDCPVVIDFPAGQVRRYAGESCRYQFTAARPLIESLIAGHQTDGVNSLFLSMRFRARRIGPYNEYLYTFFKCLAADRLMYAEGWYAGQHHDEEDIRLGDWMIQRPLPPPASRPDPVRPDRRHHAHLHHARLAVRPADRTLPGHQRQHAPPPQPARTRGNTVSPGPGRSPPGPYGVQRTRPPFRPSPGARTMTRSARLNQPPLSSATAYRSAATCAAHVGCAATVRDDSRNAASAGRSRRGEHPGAGVRVAETFIDEVCQRPRFAESGVRHLRRMTT